MNIEQEEKSTIRLAEMREYDAKMSDNFALHLISNGVFIELMAGGVGDKYWTYQTKCPCCDSMGCFAVDRTTLRREYNCDSLQGETWTYGIEIVSGAKDDGEAAEHEFWSRIEEQKKKDQAALQEAVRESMDEWSVVGRLKREAENNRRN